MAYNVSMAKTIPAAPETGNPVDSLRDAYRLPSDRYALAILTRSRQELDQVAPNAWRHVRADGRIVTITVPSR